MTLLFFFSRESREPRAFLDGKRGCEQFACKKGVVNKSAKLSHQMWKRGCEQGRETTACKKGGGGEQDRELAACKKEMNRAAKRSHAKKRGEQGREPHAKKGVWTGPRPVACKRGGCKNGIFFKKGGVVAYFSKKGVWTGIWGLNGRERISRFSKKKRNNKMTLNPFDFDPSGLPLGHLRFYFALAFYGHWFQHRRNKTRTWGRKWLKWLFECCFRSFHCWGTYILLMLYKNKIYFIYWSPN